MTAPKDDPIATLPFIGHRPLEKPGRYAPNARPGASPIDGSLA
jgi:hypothetical protein